MNCIILYLAVILNISIAVISYGAHPVASCLWCIFGITALLLVQYWLSNIILTSKQNLSSQIILIVLSLKVYIENKSQHVCTKCVLLEPLRWFV